MARDANFCTLLENEKSVRGINFAPAAKLVSGEYFWRAASVRPDSDIGPFGDTQSFTLKPIPPVPNPPKDEDGRIGFSCSGELGQTFDFQLARDAAFKKVVIEKKLDTPEISIEKPTEAGTYFMRFRATDPDGFVAPYSSPQTFVVEAKTHLWALQLLIPLLM